MEIRKTPIQDVYEIYPQIFKDDRGYFLETYKQDVFEKYGLPIQWKQDNQSFSEAGTVRGLHFQQGDFAQAKLARVVVGRVLDVCVDIRKDSATFGKFHAVILDAKLQNMLYIPKGFAHGFSVLEDAIFSYKCSDLYNKESEGGILWNDPELGIDWGLSKAVLSEKDQTWPTLKEFVKISGGGL